jgi:hypothetical protein
MKIDRAGHTAAEVAMIAREKIARPAKGRGNAALRLRAVGSCRTLGRSALRSPGSILCDALNPFRRTSWRPLLLRRRRSTTINPASWSYWHNTREKWAYKRR